MVRRLLGSAALCCMLGFVVSTYAADNYGIDPVHSSVSFKVRHMDISWVHGRFNEFSGEFSVDKDDPTKSSFTMTIKADSVDTNNKKRDGHLRSGDFFNAQQFPVMTFKSTEVKPVEGGYEMTGDFTLHGVTKPITFTLKGGKEAQFMGMQRTGFATEFVVKRADFGVGADKFAGMLGDDVEVAVSFEGIKN